MKISSLIDIIEGELINSPSISFIYNIKTNAKKVNEGDLYIAKNPNDLALAIKNGAFAIIYDFYTPILDKEIAWIQVKSYKDALIKIFRFKLSTLDLEAYSCNTITYDLLNIYKNKSFKFISSNLENCIKIIENIKDKDILFSCDENLLNKIYPKFSNFNNTKFKIT
ncbi:MAG: peptidoglycan synthetase, partial [Campylobacteraceae bacterium]|nr:peptidoglycan synthetase [Campylobacteraceae bacterium]